DLPRAVARDTEDPRIPRAVLASIGDEAAAHLFDHPAALGPNPEVAVAIFPQGPHGAVRDTALRPVPAHGLAMDLDQAGVLRPGPHRSVAGALQGKNVVGRTTGRYDAPESSKRWCDHVEPPAVADPDAVAVGKEGKDPVLAAASRAIAHEPEVVEDRRMIRSD